jgi:glycosyltransferase involved in cell wall biosynthesis
VALGFLGLVEEARLRQNVRAFLRRLEADLLHVNLDRFPDTSGKLALLTGREAGVHSVIATLHCTPQMPVFPEPLHHYYDRRAIRAADRVIVVSAAQKRQLVEHYGGRDESISLIPNGAARECFERRAPRVSRDEVGVAAEDFLVVHVGSFGPWRGQLVLAQSLVSLKRPCPRLRAAFLGAAFDREYQSAVEQLLAREGEGRHRVLGYRPDATEIMRLADVMVVSSFEEGHSFALLEAMALGKAIAATSIESNRDSLGDGEAGLLVPPGDAAAMATAIRRLHDDEALRKRLGAAARARAERLFTQERMVRSTLDVYRRLVAAARVPPESIPELPNGERP